ncbi:hypothetical protein [Halobacillus sp. A5]|nr:hypothetical protein [Halobacillus sp. A5]
MTIHFFIYTISVSITKSTVKPFNKTHKDIEEKLLNRKAEYRNLY